MHDPCPLIALHSDHCYYTHTHTHTDASSPPPSVFCPSHMRKHTDSQDYMCRVSFSYYLHTHALRSFHMQAASLSLHTHTHTHNLFPSPHLSQMFFLSLQLASLASPCSPALSSAASPLSRVPMHDRKCTRSVLPSLPANHPRTALCGVKSWGKLLRPADGAERPSEGSSQSHRWERLQGGRKEGKA